MHPPLPTSAFPTFLFPALISLLLFFSSLPLLSAKPSHFASALTFQVEPRGEVCFYEELQQGDQFSMEFEVVRGGLLDIRLRIIDPATNTALERMAFFNRHVTTSPHHNTHHPTTLPHCTPSSLTFLFLSVAAVLGRLSE